MKRLLLALLVVGCAVSAGRSAQDKKDADKLEGKWVVVSVERDGKADDTLKGAIRVHKGNQYALTPKDGKTIAGAFKIDPSKKPATMDLTPADGRYKDKTLLGIYELTGDTLKICFAEPGKDRPTDFASKAGSGTVLAIHQRAK
jgi:uncharacterized protein (TIGR03067 family)